MLDIAFVFRQNKKWLSYEVKNTLRKQHPELYKNSWKPFLKSFTSYVFAKERWWLIIAIIVAFYYLGTLIDFHFLSVINLNTDSAKSIVDSRASNIATIISMTLAVVGLLLSNLAIKDNFTYKLLFKHSRLYAIIYFTLTTIASLICFSLLKDTIESEYFKQLTISATYLVLVILFLIGFLFRSIINFADAKNITKLLHDELIVESEEYLKESLFKKESRSKYKRKMLEFGLEEYNFFKDINAFSTSSNSETSDLDIDKLFSKPKVIKDINLKKVSKFITQMNKKGSVYYNEVRLNEVSSSYDSFLHLGVANWTSKERRRLMRCLVLKQPPKTEKNLSEFRDYYDLKFDEYSDANKLRELEKVLDTYNDLYNLEMKTKIYE